MTWNGKLKEYRRLPTDDYFGEDEARLLFRDIVLVSVCAGSMIEIQYAKFLEFAFECRVWSIYIAKVLCIAI